jgi:uncharacterized LabA/DUF88 family protein
MERICVFIDGFNLYHGIKKTNVESYKWCNLRKLLKHFIDGKKQEISEIIYFTAYCTWNNSKKKRHELYTNILEDDDIKIVPGKYARFERTFDGSFMEILECIPPEKSPNSLRYSTKEEKKTDVNIALSIFEKALEGAYDHAFIVSVDSDLVPAVELTKKHFPNIKFTCIRPPFGKGHELVKCCEGNSKKITKDTLKASLLDDVVLLKNGKTISKPEKYCD